MESAPPNSTSRQERDTAPLLLVDGRIIAKRYRLEALLGRGAQGEVYRAIQIEIDRPVAVKLLTGEVTDLTRERFLREVRITAELKHPGVAVVYDGEISAEGQSFCAMELLVGETLAERIARERTIPASELVPIAAGICSALDAVHKKKLLHRDIKPSNIFLAKREDGGIDPKLIDFGIAKSIEIDAPTVIKRATLIGLGKKRVPPKTVPGTLAGTPAYLSPEQIEGHAYDARSDIYSLSVTLYEALTGSLPFDVSDLSELLIRILYEAPEPLQAKAKDAAIPASIAEVILRGLSKEPENRFASAGEFSNAL